jgi:hypothetical protein
MFAFIELARFAAVRDKYLPRVLRRLKEGFTRG